MSRIDDLVKELCPDGVMGVPLGDLCTFNRGRWIKASELHEGTIPVVTSSQNVSAWHDESNRRGETIVVASSGAYAGFVSFWNEPIYVSNAFSVDPNESSGIVPKFLFHVLRRRQREINAMASVAGVPNVYGKDLARMVVQIPPLAVQREIVRILDQFTQLEAELEAELEARRVQYAFYRSRLLSFQPGSLHSGAVDSKLWVKLGDVVEVRSGWGFPKEYQQGNMGPVPFYKVGDMNAVGNEVVMSSPQNSVSESTARGLGVKIAPEGTVIFPKIGAALKTNKKRILSIPSAYDNNVMGLIPKGDIVPRFLLHWMQTLDLAVLANDSGAVPSIRKSDVERVLFPVISIEEQRRIAGILDKFDALVNDLNSGLPAEIAARRKQYEYYRDRLLTFPEKGASA